MKRGLCICLCVVLLGVSGVLASAVPADSEAGGAKVSLYQPGQDVALEISAEDLTELRLSPPLAQTEWLLAADRDGTGRWGFVWKAEVPDGLPGGMSGDVAYRLMRLQPEAVQSHRNDAVRSDWVLVDAGDATDTGAKRSIWFADSGKRLVDAERLAELAQQDLLGQLERWGAARRPEAQDGEADTPGTLGQAQSPEISDAPVKTLAPTAASKATAVPKVTREPLPDATPTPTATPAASPLPTDTPIPKPTPEPTATPALVVLDATATPTVSPSPLPSATPEPTAAPTTEPTPEPTPEPTQGPEGIMPVVRWWPTDWLLIAMAVLLCASVLCLLWATRRGKRRVAKLPPHVDGESTLDTEKRPSKGKKEKGGDA